MSIRLALTLVLLSVVSSRGSQLSDAVLHSPSYGELMAQTRKCCPTIQTPEAIADALFAEILGGDCDSSCWHALEHYRSLTDAGASLAFARSCFDALRRDPLIFYRRYMSGDSRALNSMRDALSYDFSAYVPQPHADYTSVNGIYEDVLTRIEDQHDSLTERQAKRHRKFMNAARKQFAAWRSRYANA